MLKTLHAADNLFLEDHVIAGNRVFPTVCAIAWMADAAASVYGGFHYAGVENYQLFKGIVFDGNEAEDYFIDLNLMEGDRHSNKDTLQVSARISSLNTNGKPVFHYAADVLLIKDTLQSKSYAADLPLLEDSRVTEEASMLYENGSLFHGVSLQGITAVMRCDQQGLLLACRIPEFAQDKQGQFPIARQNIFANDLVYQSMLVWVRKQLGLGSLPSLTKSWSVYSTVQAGEAFYLLLTVVDTKPDRMVADISLVHADKRVIAEIKSAEVTVSETLNDLFLHESL